MDQTDEDTGEYDFDEGGEFICGDIQIPPPPKSTGIEDGRRLVITRVEIYNFKSYGRTQILGPFHKCFTSIVGPNGSGKSNVIDALLFVFGYRAQKLRLKKLSLLIHNSDTYPDCTSCSVKVYFAQIYDKIEDQMDIIEGSEFTISRTAHKDNSSYYCVNDKRIQFKDVSNLLMSHGIDLRYNRFLILQGEVEQISLMKPKAEDDGEPGMLEFLEDIIGTTRLKTPLEKINQRITELNEIRAEKMNRCKIVKKEQDILESAKNEAMTYIKEENKLYNSQACLYRRHEQKSIGLLEAEQKQHSEAAEILKEAMKGIEEIKEKQKQRQQTFDEINAQLDVSNKQSDAMNEKRKALEKEGEQSRLKDSNATEKGKKILADMTMVKDMSKEAADEFAKFNEQIEPNQAKLERVQKEWTEAEEELTEQRGTLEGDIKPLREKREKFEVDLMAMQKDINNAKAAHDIEVSDKDQYLLAERQERSKLISLESDLKGYQSGKEDDEKLRASVTADLPAIEQLIEEKSKGSKELKEEMKQIQVQLNQDNQVLIDARELFRDRRDRNKVLTKLMEQKRSGAIPGIIGRLGDLATIDKKYDIAISTICGGRLDNILTDCVQTNAQCIDYLKKNDIGSATFIALDQLQKYHHADFDFSVPAERLIDLIEVQDDLYIPVFSNMLRDTLVAETLDLADQIAYSGRGWTVVTLNGLISRSTGVYTGGGRPIQGKMRLTSSDRRTSLAAGLSEEDIQNLERNVQKLRQDLFDKTGESERLDREVAQAKKDYESIKNKLPTIEMKIEEAKKAIASLEKQIDEQKIKIEKVKPDPAKVEAFEDKIKVLADNYDALREQARVFEDKIAEVDNQIKSLISEKVGPAERKVNKLKKEHEETSFAISKAEAGKKNATRTMEKCQEKIAQYKKEVHEINELKAQLKTRRHEIIEEITKLDEEREKIKEERSKLTEDLKEHQSELNSLKLEESKLQTANIDVKHQLDLLAKKVEDRQKEIAKWRHMIEGLKPSATDGLDIEVDQEDADMNDMDTEDLIKSIENQKKVVEKMGRNVNLGAIEEYRKKHALYIECSKELDEITRRRDDHREAFEKVKNMRMNEFKQGFMIINRKLKEMYRMITLGGDAELEYCDSLDPFLEGIVFSVRPNKKTWKRISNLSGGEKTLSSLSLIFALHHYKPSPLYVMDEIDAALDFKNVSIVGNYIKERTKNTQFLIISLRNNMYELSDCLIGIYKTYNSTKSVPLALA